jgi:hypothetical protein
MTSSSLLTSMASFLPSSNCLLQPRPSATYGPSPPRHTTTCHRSSRRPLPEPLLRPTVRNTPPPNPNLDRGAPPPPLTLICRQHHHRALPPPLSPTASLFSTTAPSNPNLRQPPLRVRAIAPPHDQTRVRFTVLLMSMSFSRHLDKQNLYKLFYSLIVNRLLTNKQTNDCVY